MPFKRLVFGVLGQDPRSFLPLNRNCFCKDCISVVSNVSVVVAQLGQYDPTAPPQTLIEISKIVQTT